MLRWLRDLGKRMGLVSDNGQVIPVTASPVPDVPIDSDRRTQQLTAIEVDNIKLEAEALEAEAQLQQALVSHQETLTDANPELQKIARQLRDMDQQAAGEQPAQT